MGDPKRQKKHYERPKKIWDKAKVEERRHFTEAYGLKNKREIWKSETFLRKKRASARKLLAQPVETRKQREKELLESLLKVGILKKNATLDDVLGLKVEAVLERRLQTIVWKQGLAATLKQARQLITHGHIGINGKKITAPGYIVRKDEETKIGFLDKALEIKIKKAAQKKKETLKPEGKGAENKPVETKTVAQETMPKEEKTEKKEDIEKEKPEKKESKAKPEQAKTEKPHKKETIQRKKTGKEGQKGE
ncbi:MAG: 30S ribosomal protein S4 [Candidatus Diapherotrites archaeon]